ncbi:MAG TPA: PaaI family thioesterase [Acidimicrobiales bacterium]|nr:PaaI family thioesterase [Acidimicrobiales bacterium]
MSDVAEGQTKTQRAIAAFLELLESGEHMFSALEWVTVTEGDGQLVVDLPFDARHAGPRGHLQGGVTATLADYVGGRLAMAGLEPNQIVVTSDLSVHYLSGIETGLARAVATILRAGRGSRVVRVDIFDGVDGQLAAACTVAFRVVTAG